VKLNSMLDGGCTCRISGVSLLGIDELELGREWQRAREQSSGCRRNLMREYLASTGGIEYCKTNDGDGVWIWLRLQ